MPDTANRITAGRRLTGLGLLALTVMLAELAGCAAYRLRGRVIEGSQSQVLVVDRNDPRLTQRGLGGASIQVTQDPESLGRQVVGTGSTGGQGGFSISLSSFGAGFLEYQMLIVARRRGHTPAQRIMQLPGGDQRLLIVLQPGKDKLPGDQGDLLDNTLKMSQPYLHEP